MGKTRRVSENSSPAYEHDPKSTSSRFLFDSFHFSGHPLMVRNYPTDSKLENINEENHFTQKRRVRQLCEGVLSSTKETPFQFGSQHETDKRKSLAALTFVNQNYGSLRESRLSSPFLVHTQSTDYSSSVNKRRDFSREISALQNTAQAVSYSQNKEIKLLSASKHRDEGEELTDEPSEKRRKENSFDDEDAKPERESYWERRRKNNASAKKSRDARKTRELQTQTRAAFLERENMRILTQLMIVQQENACLKRVLYSKMSSLDTKHIFGKHCVLAVF